MSPKDNTRRIAIFASGSGTNAENIIRYFTRDKPIVIQLVLTNNKNAFVIDRARQLGVQYRVFDRNTFYNTDEIHNLLKSLKIDLVVLAGFLWLVPEKLIRQYSGRIVNIHPALLPKYGGKGMYGHRVHEEVIRSGDKESGISIHMVNENYDEGKIIFQAKCPVLPGDTIADLEAKIHDLEYRHYPEVIEKLLLSLEPLPGS